MGKPIEIKVEMDPVDFIHSLSSEEIMEVIKNAQKDVLEPKFDLQLLNCAIDAVIEDITEYGVKMNENEVNNILTKISVLNKSILKNLILIEDK